MDLHDLNLAAHQVRAPARHRVRVSASNRLLTSSPGCAPSTHLPFVARPFLATKADGFKQGV
jgi:hypothetical protein